MNTEIDGRCDTMDDYLKEISIVTRDNKGDLTIELPDDDIQNEDQESENTQNENLEKTPGGIPDAENDPLIEVPNDTHDENENLNTSEKLEDEPIEDGPMIEVEKDEDDTTNNDVKVSIPDVDPDLEKNENQDPDYSKPESNEPEETVELEPVLNESCAAILNTPGNESSQKNLVTERKPRWNGKRPFAKAVDKYKEMLNNEIAKAKKQLEDNTQYSYAKVRIPMFSKIEVDYVDKFGEQCVKKFYVHEAHYGPHCRQEFLPDIPINQQKWMTFLVRDILIWTRLEQEDKHPGGDGTGKDNTACSPFRAAQVALLKEKLYLIDASDVVFDGETNSFSFHVHIALYRTPPKNGPFRAPHGYGFIPHLGSAERQTKPMHTSNPTFAHSSINHTFSPMMMPPSGYFVNPPIFQPPIMQPPIFCSPMMYPSVMQQQVMQQPVFQQPVMQQPVMQQPMFHQSGMQQPVMQQPDLQQSNKNQPMQDHSNKNNNVSSKKNHRHRKRNNKSKPENNSAKND